MQFAQICLHVRFYITKTYNGLISPQFIALASIARQVVVVVVVVVVVAAASSFASA